MRPVGSGLVFPFDEGEGHLIEGVAHSAHVARVVWVPLRGNYVLTLMTRRTGGDAEEAESLAGPGVICSAHGGGDT